MLTVSNFNPIVNVSKLFKCWERKLVFERSDWELKKILSNSQLKLDGEVKLLLIYRFNELFKNSSFFPRMKVTLLAACFAGFSALAGGVIQLGDYPPHLLVSICSNFPTIGRKAHSKRSSVMQSTPTQDLNFHNRRQWNRNRPFICCPQRSILRSIALQSYL